MTLLRLLLLLAIAGFLVVFTLSNWAVTMQLVFLGIRSPALPLSLWVLGAIALGILTTLLISALFGLTGFTARRSAKRPQVSSGSGYAYTQTSPYTRASEPPRSYPSSEPSRSTKTTSDDWEDDASDWFDDSGDDWTDEPKPRSRRTDFEVKREPTSSSRSGSAYSYTYREPQRSNPEPPPADDSVVDADYRVIVPPRRDIDDEFEDDQR